MDEAVDRGYQIKQSQERANFCKDVMRKVDTKIGQTKTLALQRVERMKEVKEAQIKEDADMLAREEDVKKIERERQEKIENQRRELAMRIQEGNESMLADEPVAGKKRERKKKEKEAVEAGESSEGEREGKKVKLSKKYVVSSDEDI
jgi:ABC-type uncharacterized transport system ATPase subunit